MYKSASDQDQPDPDATEPAIEPAIELTLFTAHSRLSKRIALDADGQPVSDTGTGVLFAGKANRVRLDPLRPMVALAELIEGMSPGQALALGQLRDGLPEWAPVATAAQAAGSKVIIARTQEFLIYKPGPGVLLLDFDRKGMPEPVRDRLAALGGFHGAMEAIWPGYARMPRVVRGSTSSGLYRTDSGVRFPDSGGLHVFVMVDNIARAPELLATLHRRAWAAGLGWVWLSAAGVPLPRSIVDVAVGGSERLVYEGAPELVPPLAQDARTRQPVVAGEDGQPGDTAALLADDPATETAYHEAFAAAKAAALPAVRRAQRVRYKALREQGATATEARRVVEWREGGRLLPGDRLHFDQHGWVDVRDLLHKYRFFDGETLADPAEPDYGSPKPGVPARNKAVVRVGAVGEDITIWSQAHGGLRYFPQWPGLSSAEYAAIFQAQWERQQARGDTAGAKPHGDAGEDPGNDAADSRSVIGGAGVEDGPELPPLPPELEPEEARATQQAAVDAYVLKVETAWTAWDMLPTKGRPPQPWFPPLVVEATPGLGKTQALGRALAQLIRPGFTLNGHEKPATFAMPVEVFFHTGKLADETTADWRERHAVPTLRHHGRNENSCDKYGAVKELGAEDTPIAEHTCAKWDDESKEHIFCSSMDTCSGIMGQYYYAYSQKLRQSRMFHHLNQFMARPELKEFRIAPPGLQVVDEMPLDSATEIVTVALDALLTLRQRFKIGRVTVELPDGTVPLLRALHDGLVAGKVEIDQLPVPAEPPPPPVPPGRIKLNRLPFAPRVEQKPVPAAVKLLGKIASELSEAAMGWVTPDMPESEALAAIASSIRPYRLRKLARMLEAIAKALREGWHMQNFKVVPQKGGPALMAFLRRDVPHRRPTILADATPCLPLLEKLYDGPIEHVVINARANLRVAQVDDWPFSSKFMRDPGRRASLLRLARRCQRIEPTLLITYKHVVRAILELLGIDPGKTQKDYWAAVDEARRVTGLALVHFGAERGSNAYTRCRTVIICGRNEISPIDAENLAMAHHCDEPEPIALLARDEEGHVTEQMARERDWIRLRNDGAVPVLKSVHKDTRVQTVRELYRELGLKHSVYRSRPVGSAETHTVLLLTNIPVPGLQVDVTLKAADALPDWRDQLSDALGGGIELLAPGEIARAAATHGIKVPAERTLKRAVSKGHLTLSIYLERNGPLKLSYRRQGVAGKKPMKCLLWPENDTPLTIEDATRRVAKVVGYEVIGLNLEAIEPVPDWPARTATCQNAEEAAHREAERPAASDRQIALREPEAAAPPPPPPPRAEATTAECLFCDDPVPLGQPGHVVLGGEGHAHLACYDLHEQAGMPPPPEPEPPPPEPEPPRPEVHAAQAAGSAPASAVAAGAKHASGSVRASMPRPWAILAGTPNRPPRPPLSTKRQAELAA